MCTILRKDIWRLDSFNGVTETYHLTSLTLSLDVTGQFHLVLLDRVTWRYWTVSPGVTEPHHLMLLDSFTWRNWTVSPDVTGQFHLSLLDLLDSFTLRYWNLSPDVTGQQSSCSICNDQLFNLRLFLKMIAITWQISQWHSKISWSIFSK